MNSITQAHGQFSNCGPGVDTYELSYNCKGPSCSSINGFQGMKCNADGGSAVTCSNDIKCPPGIASYSSNFTFSQNAPDPLVPAHTEADNLIRQEQHVLLASCAKFSLSSDGTEEGTRVDGGGVDAECPIKVQSTPNALVNGNPKPATRVPEPATGGDVGTRVTQPATRTNGPVAVDNQQSTLVNAQGATRSSGAASGGNGPTSAGGAEPEETGVGAPDGTGPTRSELDGGNSIPTSPISSPGPDSTSNPEQFTGFAYSRRRTTKHSLFLTLLLGLMMILPGAQAHRTSNRNRREEIHARAKLQLRAVSDKVRVFATNFGADLAAKANSQGQNGDTFAHNLVADVVSSVCGGYFSGEAAESFTPAIVGDCVKSIYGGDKLSQPGTQFLAVFGASLLCDYAVSEAFPPAAEFYPEGCEGLEDLARKETPPGSVAPFNPPSSETGENASPTQQPNGPNSVEVPSPPASDLPVIVESVSGVSVPDPAPTPVSDTGFVSINSPPASPPVPVTPEPTLALSTPIEVLPETDAVSSIPSPDPSAPPAVDPSTPIPPDTVPTPPSLSSIQSPPPTLVDEPSITPPVQTPPLSTPTEDTPAPEVPSEVITPSPSSTPIDDTPIPEVPSDVITPLPSSTPVDDVPTPEVPSDVVTPLPSSTPVDDTPTPEVPSDIVTPSPSSTPVEDTPTPDIPSDVVTPSPSSTQGSSSSSVLPDTPPSTTLDSTTLPEPPVFNTSTSAPPLSSSVQSSTISEPPSLDTSTSASVSISSSSTLIEIPPSSSSIVTSEPPTFNTSTSISTSTTPPPSTTSSSSIIILDPPVFNTSTSISSPPTTTTSSSVIISDPPASNTSTTLEPSQTPTCIAGSDFPDFCFSEFGDGCTSLMSDESNCGECGHSCSYWCQSGECVCPDDQILVENSFCVNDTTSTSPSPTAPTPCPTNSTFDSEINSCVPVETPSPTAPTPCPTNSTFDSEISSCVPVETPLPSCEFAEEGDNFCPGYGCVFLDSSRENCGGCGNVCESACSHGRCVCLGSDALPDEEGHCPGASDDSRLTSTDVPCSSSFTHDPSGYCVETALPSYTSASPSYMVTTPEPITTPASTGSALVYTPPASADSPLIVTPLPSTDPALVYTPPPSDPPSSPTTPAILETPLPPDTPSNSSFTPAPIPSYVLRGLLGAW